MLWMTCRSGLPLSSVATGCCLVDKKNHYCLDQGKRIVAIAYGIIRSGWAPRAAAAISSWLERHVFYMQPSRELLRV